MTEPEEKARITSGGKNLILMGISAILIAFLTTGVSLAIYHNSGDIYLDRSRPGFLPDEEELELDENKVDDYDLKKSGRITAEVLNEYIEHLEAEMKVIDSYENPFGPGVLSDEHLGIPAE